MRAVGESLQRVDAIKKVTGQAQYVDDIIMPRMLYAQVKRSPYPHARILRIDTSKAEALPGVRSVITGDCYTKRCGLYLEDKNFLAVGTAKYRGEAVAAVAAETPEIADGQVEIRNIAREAGSRSKMAVRAAMEGIDPVGACVGPHGGRVGAVVKELGGEKIDIVVWSEDPCQYVRAALSPADVIDVSLIPGQKACRVIVPDDQLSLAIGKEGQNARLAARLTGYKIDIKPASQAEPAEETEEA